MAKILLTEAINLLIFLCNPLTSPNDATNKHLKVSEADLVKGLDYEKSPWCLRLLSLDNRNGFDVKIESG